MEHPPPEREWFSGHRPAHRAMEGPLTHPFPALASPMTIGTPDGRRPRVAHDFHHGRTVGIGASMNGGGQIPAAGSTLPRASAPGAAERY